MLNSPSQRHQQRCIRGTQEALGYGNPRIRIHLGGLGGLGGLGLGKPPTCTLGEVPPEAGGLKGLNFLLAPAFKLRPETWSSLRSMVGKASPSGSLRHPEPDCGFLKAAVAGFRTRRQQAFRSDLGSCLRAPIATSGRALLCKGRAGVLFEQTEAEAARLTAARASQSS